MLSQWPEVHLSSANTCLQNLHFQKSKKVRRKKLNTFCSDQSDILDADLWVHLPFAIVHACSSYDEPNPGLEKEDVHFISAFLRHAGRSLQSKATNQLRLQSQVEKQLPR